MALSVKSKWMGGRADEVIGRGSKVPENQYRLHSLNPTDGLRPIAMFVPRQRSEACVGDDFRFENILRLT